MSQSKEKGFFSSKTMLCFVIISLVCAVAITVANGIGFILWDNTAFCLSVLCALFSLVVYITYKNHDTNAMKPSIGIIFGILVQQECSLFAAAVYDVDFTAGFKVYAWLALNLMRLIMIFIICINHILISSGHQSSKKAVRFNIGSLCVLAAVYILEIIVSALVSAAEKTVFLIVLDLISTCSLAVIIIVEKKLDYFRALREKQNN